MAAGTVLLGVEIQILLFFGLGMLLKHIGMIDEGADRFLSEFIMGLVMPFNVFLSFYRTVSLSEMRSGLLLIAAGTCVAAIVMAAGRLIPRGIPVEKRRIAEYSMLISNGSLIGLPLIQALCGERGVFYANIFMIPTRILAFTAADRYFDADWRWRGFGPGMKRFAANPIVLGMVLGTALNALGIALPDSVLSVCGSISGCMTPLALILVGSTVMDISSVRAAVSLPILLISLFRLVAAPLLTRLVCAVLGLGALETMAAVLVNAAPVASTATIFCKKYGGDAAFTSSSVFVSTLLSFGTLWFIRA